jgi:hypothetical protein
VIQYISKSAEILLEIKIITDILDLDMQLQLNQAKTAAYMESKML